MTGSCVAQCTTRDRWMRANQPKCPEPPRPTQHSAQAMEGGGGWARTLWYRTAHPTQRKWGTPVRHVPQSLSALQHETGLPGITGTRHLGAWRVPRVCTGSGLIPVRDRALASRGCGEREDRGHGHGQRRTWRATDDRSSAMEIWGWRRGEAAVAHDGASGYGTERGLQVEPVTPRRACTVHTQRERGGGGLDLLWYAQRVEKGKRGKLLDS